MHLVQPRPFNLRKTLITGSVLLILMVVYLTRDPAGPASLQWRGHTMGTHYDVQIAQSPLSQAESRKLEQRIKHYLRDINQQMSTYIADSEISTFNRSSDTAPYPVSPHFARVTRRALHWANQSGGAFDPTLDPLINLWGFGQRTVDQQWPDEAAVAAALAQTGFDALHVPDHAHLQKDRAEIQLNLNAIAKGYAADGIGLLIETAGATNYFVELGGDLVASGLNHQQVPWRVGVEWPDPDAPRGEALYAIAHLQEGALAGSGHYRQIRTGPDGQLYSHIIDPRTGYPTVHDLAAVHVWAVQCMDADAVATALMVMGIEDGLAWVEDLPDIEALFFRPTNNGTFEAILSSGFEARTNLERVSQ